MSAPERSAQGALVGPRAKGLYDLARSRIEDMDRRGQPIAPYARTAEMAVRIATIIAAGRHSDTVDVIDMLCGVSKGEDRDIP